MCPGKLKCAKDLETDVTAGGPISVLSGYFGIARLLGAADATTGPVSAGGVSYC